jgi:predicted metal-dependent hydrolase
MSQQLPGTSSPEEGWNEEPLPAFLRGIEQFNQRDYFECHETLEGIWNDERRPIRTLYKGILQVGVGCYHLLRNNYRGATIKLDSGARYLEPFAPRCLGVNVAKLIADARKLHSTLLALGPDHFREVDLRLLPIIAADAPDAPPGER